MKETYCKKRPSYMRNTRQLPSLGFMSGMHTDKPNHIAKIDWGLPPVWPYKPHKALSFLIKYRHPPQGRVVFSFRCHFIRASAICRS